MTIVRWVLGLTVSVALVVPPYVYYRWQYTHGKRLRVVEPGVFYRSGQLTPASLDEAIAKYKIRTVINFQDEAPDPEIAPGLSESEFCRRRGVRYIFIQPDLLDRSAIPASRPKSIDTFLAVMDDPDNHPVLVHCRAGVHRTGLFAALYRMEYQGWSLPAAIHELKVNGFGDSKCTACNDYIMQYLLIYQPRSHAGNPKSETHTPKQLPHLKTPNPNPPSQPVSDVGF